MDHCYQTFAVVQEVVRLSDDSFILPKLVFVLFTLPRMKVLLLTFFVVSNLDQNSHLFILKIV